MVWKVSKGSFLTAPEKSQKCSVCGAEFPRSELNEWREKGKHIAPRLVCYACFMVLKNEGK